ncbi:MAG: anthranilate synthase component I family protein [Nitrospinae bacterium]|nr:anthranilate synthase component I family protein [Nitrospinota bacterium]
MEFNLSEENYNDVRKSYEKVIVTAKLNQFISPLKTYEGLKKELPFSALLDSCGLNLETSRYSYIAIEAEEIIKAKGRVIRYQKNDINIRYTGDPLYFINGYLSRKTYQTKSSFFCGGGIGYFAYETYRYFQKIPLPPIEPEKLPDIYFFFPKVVLCFDELEKKVYISYSLDSAKEEYSEATNFIEKVFTEIKEIEHDDNERMNYKEDVVQKNLSAGFHDADYSFAENINLKKIRSQKEFEEMVKKAKEYIADGDIYQVNLSQRFEYETEKEPWEIYKTLRKINPSPFSAYLQLEDLVIISSSPERLIKKKNDKLETRPIAGSRPRGISSEHDEELSKELLLNSKELAEHIMMIDLERNDIGRVSEKGSVIPEPSIFIENYSHVKHIVSNISGKVLKSVDWIDILISMFPGGTITGCPKIRSMEIIAELEEMRRGIYTGSLGWIGYNGDFDLNIIIRTFLWQNKLLSFYTGAGIVHDSIPENEYKETLKKAEALIRTITIE